MTCQRISLYLWVIGILATALLWTPGIQAQSAPPPKDHVTLYNRAVSLLDQAQKKLEGNYTAEAKALVKEANALFTTLVEERSQELSERELTPWEAEQETINKKLAADCYAQNERLIKSCEEKLAKGEELTRQGQDKLAEKYYREAKNDADRAYKMAVKAEIYNLRTIQLILGFLKKSSRG